ncbi:FAD-dependent oxidoreductase [Acidiferrimicrobium sp. IK]|uniref:dihydrolipoyl dehydrogenase family protein n=1 Tax=Acidiferrimicrobium sp. IK TaxID=2871700 RepID=UPI0021CB358A|nr:FAD-dependent oxidoreductase [Acidiferrimicrobium sp. IK]MCU4186553.1 FAD-dependent oxidoreductase [Acidiferrimicrobium sp. IK]
MSVAVKFVIIGGGPAGNTAATYAARLGADVTLIERDVLGGAAHLWDCIPSKTMIATGGAMSFADRISGMGLSHLDAHLEVDAQRKRIQDIENRLKDHVTELLVSQEVRLIHGTARLKGPHAVVVETQTGLEELEADAILVSTGTRPRIPAWVEPDGDRILTTRQAYPPKTMPEHLVVVGSGVTGVEFVHMFASFGSKVTLIVSRQQVLPNKDPEVAAALEDELLRRGVRLFKGARAEMIERTEAGVAVACDDGRVALGTHALLAIGSIPNSDGMGLEEAGVVTDGGYIEINQHCQSSVPHIYAAGDVSGKLPLSSVASMQGRKIAEHVMGIHTREHRHIDYEKAASAIFTEPEIADVGLAEADAFATGRKIRVTKVPYAATAKALINDDPGGFVKIISDPATGVVLGGSIVGRHAAELISVIALAVTANLKVSDIVESCLVHPTLSEALADAAE